MGARQRLTAPSRLSVDADADLHLALGEVEDRLPRRRRGARRERDTERPRPLVDPPGDPGDGLQVIPAFGRRAGDLLGQHRRSDAAPSGGVEGVLDRDVVVEQDRLDLDAFIRRVLRGELEVHHVTGVVLDEMDHARAAVDRLGRRQHLLRNRGGEDRARTGRVQHPGADEPAVKRLVSGAAARDQPDLVLHRGVGADDDPRLGVVAEQVGVRRGQSGHRLLNDRFRIVEELLHRRCRCRHRDSPHLTAAGSRESSWRR